MSRPLVIIHGWSDTEASFQTLAKLIAARRGVEVCVISLGRYISMNDFVTFPDLVAAMDKAWTDKELPRDPGSVDAIVHSTGGLVIRDWMSSTFEPAKVPIKHLVMLAPANFGSPLAHKGRAFYGRVLKGFIPKLLDELADPLVPKANDEDGYFQTGTQILKGLELASPYSWNLALRDRFSDWAEAYRPGLVLCTVLVGNRGYDGIRSIANEDGSDGTVRVSTANLNCVHIMVDFVADPMKPSYADPQLGRGEVAFRVVDGHNHGSITLNNSKLRSKSDKQVMDLILAALDVEDDKFHDWSQECLSATKKVSEAGASRSETQGFQNTVVRVIDHEGNPVKDYLIEFYEDDDDKNLIAKLFHTTALVDVHAYGDDPSYRSLYVNCTRLSKTIDKVKEALRISITAHPAVGVNAPVGFRTLGDDQIGGIRIPREQIDVFFKPNRTVLVTIRIRRDREDKVFRFLPAGG